MKKCLLTLPFLVMTSAMAENSPAQALPSCHHYEKDMLSTTTCYYKNSNLSQVYQAYRNHTTKSEQQYLLPQLPNTFKKVTILPNTDNVTVTYTPKKSGMTIEQFFAGGETTIDFSRTRNNGFKVTTVLAPD